MRRSGGYLHGMARSRRAQCIYFMYQKRGGICCCAVPGIEKLPFTPYGPLGEISLLRVRHIGPAPPYLTPAGNGTLQRVFNTDWSAAAPPSPSRMIGQWETKPLNCNGHGIRPQTRVERQTRFPVDPPSSPTTPPDAKWYFSDHVAELLSQPT
ncbi:hypothetical protein SKAU_G00037550 [Synaphobranchus kaupii]|uniref:Uncharacterized protein n=1 Tax=Synaphobranchus kaupii TaxID=118154 RepID=A0A9Q1JH51_SYNKA|nr:hypothetical protein SKAU_G00037550 [Synaphobranchus kaupii]